MQLMCIWQLVQQSFSPKFSTDFSVTFWLCSFISYVKRMHNISLSLPPPKTLTHENTLWPSGLSDACWEHSMDKLSVWEGYQHGLLQGQRRVIGVREKEWIRSSRWWNTFFLDLEQLQYNLALWTKLCTVLKWKWSSQPVRMIYYIDFHRKQ